MLRNVHRGKRERESLDWFMEVQVARMNECGLDWIE